MDTSHLCSALLAVREHRRMVPAMVRSKRTSTETKIPTLERLPERSCRRRSCSSRVLVARLAHESLSLLWSRTPQITRGSCIRRRPSAPWPVTDSSLRGENCRVCILVSTRNGTPPLARGKPGRPSRRCRYRRNTPACTGKTTSTPGSIRAPAEHPRLHGENASCRCGGSTPIGTPPLARGKLRCRVSAARRSRLAPACTGKTTKSCGGS